MDKYERPESPDQIYAAVGWATRKQAHFVERLILVVVLAGKLAPRTVAPGGSCLRNRCSTSFHRCPSRKPVSRPREPSKHPIVLSVSRSRMPAAFFSTLPFPCPATFVKALPRPVEPCLAPRLPLHLNCKDEFEWPTSRLLVTSSGRGSPRWRCRLGLKP